MCVTLRNVSMAIRDLENAAAACRFASAAAFLSACFFNAAVMLEDIVVMLFCTACDEGEGDESQRGTTSESEVEKRSSVDIVSYL